MTPSLSRQFVARMDNSNCASGQPSLISRSIDSTGVPSHVAANRAGVVLAHPTDGQRPHQPLRELPALAHEVERPRQRRPRPRGRERRRLVRHRSQQRVGVSLDEREDVLRTPFAVAHASHSVTSMRTFRMRTRFTSALEIVRTSALSSARFPAATTHVPGGSVCSPIRRSRSSE